MFAALAPRPGGRCSCSPSASTLAANSPAISRKEADQQLETLLAQRIGRHRWLGERLLAAAAAVVALPPRYSHRPTPAAK
jgi:hypothetical protein